MRQAKSEQQTAKLDADFLQKLKSQTIAKGKEAEQRHAEPDTEPAQSEKTRELLKWRGIDRFLDKEPPKPDLLFRGKDWEIRSNLITAIFATGGTGKTFLGLQLAASLATGVSLEPFTPARKRKVLYLCGEDSEEILHERLNAIYKYMPGLEENREHLSRNLCVESLVGRDRVLMQLDENRNPTTTDTFAWLSDTIAAIPGLEVLVIDPMGKFHRLNENDNGHANAWISALEQLQVDHKLSVIFTHHESKAQVKNGSLEESSGRGAGALRDGVRGALSMAGMDRKTAKKYGIENPNKFVQILPTKANNSSRPGNGEWFERTEGGVLKPYSLIKEHKQHQADILLQGLVMAFTGQLENEDGEKIDAVAEIDYRELTHKPKTPTGKGLTLFFDSNDSVKNRQSEIPPLLATLAGMNKIRVTETKSGKTRKRIITLFNAVEK